MSQDMEREALLLQTVEALRNYVDVIAKAGGGDKMLFMAAMREADDKARAALAAIGPQDFGDLTGVQPCCGDYANCHRACTPRGRWQATKDREDALATQPPAVQGEPLEWGSTKTAGQLIRQLQTFDPATPITAACHTDYEGKRMALARPLVMSRERVAGRFIRQGDESVPYSLVIWSQQDEAASPPSREPLTPDSWEEIEAVIACLGDDAAQLREENAEDERAANMERAADLLAFAYGIHSRGEGESNG